MQQPSKISYGKVEHSNFLQETEKAIVCYDIVDGIKEYQSYPKTVLSINSLDKIERGDYTFPIEVAIWFLEKEGIPYNA